MKIDIKKVIQFIPRLPSIIFSSTVISVVSTILLISNIEQFGLILSTIFFYILSPVLTYFYLKKRGLITDKKLNFNIVKREERFVYNIILLLGFLTNYILLSFYHTPVVQEIALLLLLSFTAFSIVTIFWKISGHMTQTVLIILIFAYIFNDIWLYIILIGYLICIPLVGYSRLKFKHHDIWQVIAGTLLTSLIGFLSLTIF